MPPSKAQIEPQRRKNKLAESYSELLDEFSAKDLRHVGNYTLDRLIGKGSFGNVYLAKHDLTNGSKVVLKSARKDDANLAREIHHHRQFIHPHIARLYEVIVTENLVWLVLEYCPGDELYNYLLKDGALPVDKVQKIFAQLVGAVAYIHNQSCVHRDLKLENVLLDKNENVKLCDFGFTREYDGKRNHLQTFCGTICYSAPEMLRGEKYAGEKVDVWSLGVILFALLAGELPFDEDTDQATKEKILKEEPKLSQRFPDTAKALIANLLSKRPLLRPSLDSILADPFLVDHAPQQQALLKLSQPSPFTTQLEKTTLERMRIAGVNIDKVVENVAAQRCDALAGWWALLLEKEGKKERRREQRRKEREKELKTLRRLSGASARLERHVEAVKEGGEQSHSVSQSLSIDEGVKKRGRAHRRSTPHILISDLPQLPEGSAIDSPKRLTPPVPVEKDPPSVSGASRPPPPPKEHRPRTGNAGTTRSHMDPVPLAKSAQKRSSSRRRQLPLLSQWASLKHWLLESTKRARSPAKTPPPSSGQPSIVQSDGQKQETVPTTPSGHQRTISQATEASHSSTGRSTTTDTSYHKTNVIDSRRSSIIIHPRVETRTRRHRDSLSPSPLTSHSSYRHATAGLTGRKSTSSSISSIRSLHHRPTHSKASSVSSNSIETVHTPTTRSIRSPHTSVKVLPATPTAATNFPSNIRVVRSPPDFNTERSLATKGSPVIEADNDPEVASRLDNGGNGGGLIFARRKKSPFKGPSINTAMFAQDLPRAPGTPGLRLREDGRPQMLGGSTRRSLSRSGRGRKRGSVLIEEEEGETEEEVEEVDTFEPVAVKHGESVHSITVWDERRHSTESQSRDNNDTISSSV